MNKTNIITSYLSNYPREEESKKWFVVLSGWICPLALQHVLFQQLSSSNIVTMASAWSASNTAGWWIINSNNERRQNHCNLLISLHKSSHGTRCSSGKHVVLGYIRALVKVVIPRLTAATDKGVAKVVVEGWKSSTQCQKTETKEAVWWFLDLNCSGYLSVEEKISVEIKGIAQFYVYYSILRVKTKTNCCSDQRQIKCWRMCRLLICSPLMNNLLTILRVLGCSQWREIIFGLNYQKKTKQSWTITWQTQQFGWD